MDAMQQEHTTFYEKRRRNDIPTYDIIDTTPTEPEIVTALKKLKNWKSPSASGTFR